MFIPNLTILPKPQLTLWDELIATPPHFVLYGGTAIALRLGHRQSIDFDFFSTQPFTPSELIQQIPYLQNATIQQSSLNTLTCLVDRQGSVQVSFFGGLKLKHIASPDKIPENHIAIASLLDLAATKMKVILDRATYKDYFDIDALIQTGIALPTALAAAQAIYGSLYNPLLSLKALCYFEEGDVSALPLDIRQRLTHAVHDTRIDALPHLPALDGLL